MPITRLFDENAIAELCAAAPEKQQTPESFETIVMGNIQAFLETHREKVIGCIVTIEKGHVGIVYRQPGEYDNDLEDAITDQDRAYSRLGWGNVHNTAMPEAWGEEELQQFARSNLRNLVSND